MDTLDVLKEALAKSKQVHTTTTVQQQEEPTPQTESVGKDSSMEIPNPGEAVTPEIVEPTTQKGRGGAHMSPFTGVILNERFLLLNTLSKVTEMPLKIKDSDVPDSMIRSLTAFVDGTVFFDAEARVDADRAILNNAVGNLHKGDVVSLDGYSTDEHGRLKGAFRIDKIDLREIDVANSTRKKLHCAITFLQADKSTINS